MKKTNLFTFMFSLTGTGIILIVAAFINHIQPSDDTLSQAWRTLWEKYATVTRILLIAGFGLITFDIWMITRIIRQAYELHRFHGAVRRGG